LVERERVSPDKLSVHDASAKDTLLMNDERLQVKRGAKKHKSSNVTRTEERNVPSRSRSRKGEPPPSMTEVSQSVEVLNPRFGDSRLRLANRSDTTPLGMLAIRRNVLPLTTQ
jgi:hypothetical protein